MANGLDSDRDSNFRVCDRVRGPVCMGALENLNPNAAVVLGVLVLLQSSGDPRSRPIRAAASGRCLAAFHRWASAAETETLPEFARSESEALKR